MRYDWFDDYCLTKTAAWKEYKPEWDVNRYMIRDKMFLMHGNDNKSREIITLKLTPSFGQLLRHQYVDIIPGYYMNKVHWNSLFVDGVVPDEVVRSMIDESYQLIFESFSKKIQKEMME